MTRRRSLLAILLITVLVPVGAGSADAQNPFVPGARQPAQEAAKGTAVIRGRVTAADTGKPLRRVQISLVGTPPSQRLSTSTNSRGEYEVRDIPAGRYTLTVNRGGYLRMSYGERRPGDGGKPLEVADGQQLDRVDLVLHRAGSIGGRLVDETGEPIANVPVYAMRQAYYQGRRRLVPLGPGMRTDDGGNYRMFGLEPGDYYVMAVPRETWTVKGPPPQTFGYSITYFPGAANPSSAQRVQVASGQEATNIDFGLVASRTATLSGVALRGDGSPAAGANVSLGQSIMGPMGGTSSFIGNARTGADGSWTIEKIAPGEYELSVTLDDRERGRESAEMRVFVQGTDISGLTLAADPGATVSGEVTGENGGPLPSGSRLRVLVDPIGPDRQATGVIAGSDAGLVGADGRFTFTAKSGQNTLRVTGLPPRWSVASVEIGGRDYADATFEVPPGKPLDNVRIVVTDTFPTVSGRITDDRAAAVEGTVVLFRTDESRWAVQESVRSARADQNGLFRFDTVRPGEYYAIALDFVHQWQLPDPEFLSELTPGATRVTVREGQQEPLNLRIRNR
jgi:protocatechuate 3,4-dioxygenase beta subunit